MTDTAIDMARRLLEGYGLTLKQTRKERGVTVRELAEQIDVRSDIISRVEQGVWMPSPGDAQRLTEWLLQQPVPVVEAEPCQ